jgi:hypothetical protein
MIKSRSMRRAGHVASMGTKRSVGFCDKSQKEKDHREDLYIYERIILKWILER